MRFPAHGSEQGSAASPRYGPAVAQSAQAYDSVVLAHGRDLADNLVGVLLADAGPGPALLGEHTVTRAQLAARVAQMAGTLLAAVPVPGARVAIVAPNDEAFVVGYLATLWAGLVAVPANGLAPIDEMVREAEAVGVTLVLASPAHAALGRALADRLHVAAIEVTDGGAEVPPAPCAADAAAALVFTAGTGGPPKAAILTHGSLAANLAQLRARPGLALTSADISLGALPFFHVFGLNVTLGLSLACHAPIVLQPEFHPRDAIAAIVTHGVTVVAGVPAIYASFLALDDHEAPADAFRTVRLAVSGGASLAPEIADAMRSRFGVGLEHGYGLTEASPVLTTTVGTTSAIGSVGTALAGVEVRVVDVDGEDTVEQDPGEVLGAWGQCVRWLLGGCRDDGAGGHIRRMAAHG